MLSSALTSFGGDCDDTDPNTHSLYLRDGDGDGAGNTDDSICAGDHTPSGYVQPNLADCDDTNPAIYSGHALDADGDGYVDWDGPTACDTNFVPPVHTQSDCDDTDPSVAVLYTRDADGDGFAGSDETVCADPVAPPTGFVELSVRDCDDSKSDVNPFALELWDDTVDSDCDGQIYPRTCSGACPTEPTKVAIDSSCNSANLQVVEVSPSPYCYGVHWTIGIANGGTAPISAYSLAIEGDVPVTFQVTDPLAPGDERRYTLPTLRKITGSITVSVTSNAPDCSQNDGSQAAVAEPRNCSR